MLQCIIVFWLDLKRDKGQKRIGISTFTNFMAKHDRTGFLMKLIAENLSADRGEVRIFEKVSFELSAGEGMVVTGPNGAGKSTLLRVLAGFLRSSQGRVQLDGGELAPQSHFLGPNNGMKPNLSVAENLDFWRRYYVGTSNIYDALEKVQLAHVRDMPFNDLSTGQKRRVAIARVFVAHRPVWLMDEPTSGLDSDAEAMFAALVADHMNGGGIVIAATHLPIVVKGMKRLRFEGGAS
ncbi:MAG: heme ABC exporter ATP-binding protein CcmA [Ahrensia sp.]|nr:heme ABC exporter ATP-binding protein CcmA [Ahrensia sp.]